MAARHDYFYEFQLSGPNPHHGRLMAKIAQTRERIEAERGEALARCQLVRLWAVLWGIGASVLALWLVFSFDFGWSTSLKILALPLGAVPVFALSGLVILNRNRDFDRRQRFWEQEIAYYEARDPEGWWSQLCEERARHVKQWRGHWQAFREGRGGFDLYLRRYCESEGLDWPSVRRKLEADYRDYFQFIQLESREVERGGTPRRLPLRYWLQEERRKDAAAGRPTSVREARQTRAEATFAAHEGGDPAVAHFLASRAADEVTGEEPS